MECNPWVSNSSLVNRGVVLLIKISKLPLFRQILSCTLTEIDDRTFEQLENCLVGPTSDSDVISK